MSEIKGKKVELYEKYFSDNENFFDSFEKKVCFLMGVLIQRLLNIQYKDKKSTPFYNKLKNLNINQELLGRVFKQAVNKLIEYDKNYYMQLEGLISDYFVKAGNKWKINDKDISFIFTLGMSLSKSVYFKDESEENNIKGE